MNREALESLDKETLIGLVLVLSALAFACRRRGWHQHPYSGTSSFARDMTRSGSQMETP
jgi:hypothetical protein